MKLIYEKMFLKDIETVDALQEIKLEMESHDFDICENMSFEIYVSHSCLRIKVYQL